MKPRPDCPTCKGTGTYVFAFATIMDRRGEMKIQRLTEDEARTWPLESYNERSVPCECTEDKA